MFESLDDQMKLDDKAENTTQERAITILSVVLFAGLYFGIRMLE